MNKTLSLVLILLLTACAASESRDAASYLAAVDVSDGVTHTEAEHIAEAYFAVHVGCGAYSGISDGKDAWVVEGKFGYAGERIKGFLINKESGAIQSPVGPSYSHPKDMLSRAPPGAQAERGT